MPFHFLRARSPLVVLLVLAFGERSSAQDHWAKDLGGASNDHIADVRTDADGGVYVTGEFSGVATFATQTFVSAGGLDLFVAKLDAEGNVLWCQRGGGTGIDRGLKLALGPNGVVVVGEFMGDATFFGTSISSAGGTTDMMVAQLDAATGSLQWIAQGGGASGTDRPFGVSVAPNGSVVVAGEFTGAAQWGSIPLTSMDNTPDVFIASYSPTGTIGWVQQGAAPGVDRAIDVVHDGAGNIYVAGQFSDDITFDVLHTNDLQNATFLLKLDAAGNEVWFRVCGGGVFDHVRDMLVMPGGDLLLTGDLQGNMLFFDDAPDLVSATAAYTYYLLRVNASGQLTGQRTFGSDDPVSVTGLDLRNDTVSVLGTFNCQFSGFSDLYDGPGLFMALGDEDLFIARHRAGDLTVVEGQQFGGWKGKTGGRISSFPDGELVFCGSFDRNLFFPNSTNTFLADLQGNGALAEPQVTAPHCGDPWAGMFVADTSNGVNDGFVAKGYVRGRTPYDFWNRSDDDCSHDVNDLCITRVNTTPCLDSITNCGPTALHVAPRFAYSTAFGAHYVGPQFSVLWSTGSTSSTVSYNGTGWLGVEITTRNGCFTWRDSVYVTTLPLPPMPTISDDVPFNTNNLIPVRIDLCEPDSAWVWGTPPPGTTYQWQQLSDGTIVDGDSIHVGASGGYIFTVQNEQGCTRSTTVIADVNPVVPMPDLTVDLPLDFPDDTDHNDSIQICSNAPVLVGYTPTWYVDGLPSAFPDGLTLLTRINHAEWGYPPNPGPHVGQMTVDADGWLHIQLDMLVVNSPCGIDTLRFTSIDSVYVGLFPSPPLDVSVTGPTVMCPDDTLQLHATCVGCDTVIWTGPHIVGHEDHDVLVNGGGTYIASVSASDVHGCAYSDHAQLTVTVQPGPVLIMDPSDGILCPGSTATIGSSIVGTHYAWVGPSGPLSAQTQSIVASEAGEYYLVITTALGCEFVSDHVTLTSYSTPFLIASPAAILCTGDGPVLLQVTSASAGSVQWSAPLVGTGLTQSVTQPGTYSCSVVVCGISTFLTVNVTSGGANVDLLTPGPFTVCPGQPVTLQAASGQAEYTWLPGGQSGPTLVATSAGQYSVVAGDGHGCTDTSQVVLVQNIPFTQPVVGAGSSICWGQDGLLLASGSGNITWYAGPVGGTPAGSGDSLLVTQPSDTMVFQVVQQENGCTSAPITVVLNVRPIVSPYTLSAPVQLCAGDPFAIVLTGDPALTVQWSTPTGPATGTPLVFDPSTPDDNGTYTAMPSLGECLVSPQNITVNVLAPGELPWDGIATLCTGGVITLSVPLDYGTPVWSTGSSAYSIEVDGSGTYAVAVIDPQGCPVTATAVVNEMPCELVIPNVLTPNGDGINDAWVLAGGFTGGTMDIFDRWGKRVFTGDLFQHPFRGNNDDGTVLPDGVYYYVLHLAIHERPSKEMAGYIQLLR